LESCITVISDYVSVIMSEYTINIADRFSPLPAGREPEDGPYNGQLFLKEVLLPSLDNFEKVILDLEGIRSFGSSFFEEIFRGLRLTHKYSKTEIKKRIEIQATSAETRFYKNIIESYFA